MCFDCCVFVSLSLSKFTFRQNNIIMSSGENTESSKFLVLNNRTIQWHRGFYKSNTKTTNSSKFACVAQRECNTAEKKVRKY